MNVTGGPLMEPYICPGLSSMFSGTSILYTRTSWPTAALGSGRALFEACEQANRKIQVELTYQPDNITTEWCIDSVCTSRSI